MQRLASGTTRREQGVSAVIVAVMLAVLVGFAALAVDVGALWSDKKQLQNGADAAALAVAQSCAEGSCDEGQATDYAVQNKLDGNIKDVVVSYPKAGTVHVSVSSDRALWFAPVGIATVPADAQASWGPVGGASTIPITVAECVFDQGVDPATGIMRLIIKDTPSGPPKDVVEDPCATPTQPWVYPGGFHWLDVDEKCELSTVVDDIAPGNPGEGPPQPECSNDYLHKLLQGGTVLIPMYGVADADAKSYELVGYASFTPTAYCLKSNGLSWNTTKCSDNYQWIDGHFDEKVALDAVIDTGATDFDAIAVQLTG